MTNENRVASAPAQPFPLDHPSAVAIALADILTYGDLTCCFTLETTFHNMLRSSQFSETLLEER